MTDEARIVDFDPNALLKMVRVMYRAMLDYTIANPLIARIQPHEDPDQTAKKVEIDGVEPFFAIQGSQVTIINETEDDVVVKVSNSFVFGINEIEVAAGLKATLRVHEDAPPDLPFALSTDTGGIGKPITVKPPVVND